MRECVLVSPPLKKMLSGCLFSPAFLFIFLDVFLSRFLCSFVKIYVLFFSEARVSIVHLFSLFRVFSWTLPYYTALNVSIVALGLLRVIFGGGGDGGGSDWLDT